MRDERCHCDINLARQTECLRNLSFTLAVPTRALLPCSGYFDPAIAARYGIADIDWSNGRAQWARARPMDDDARLATEAAMIKAINPDTHVWIYRNLVKALSWYGAVREKLEDPQ